MVSSVISIAFGPATQAARALPGLPGQATRLGHFIVGPENALLASIAETTCQQTTYYGPILLSGPTGCGKSHFVQGITVRFAQRFPSAKIVTTTGSNFARDLANAIDSNATSEFREHQRSASLFVLEDLHEIVSKGAAQEELIQTLDAFHHREKPVLATAHAAITELPTLLPALRSRFCGGLTIPIAYPSAATRRVMLNHLTEVHAIAVSEQVANLLTLGTEKQPAPFQTFSALRHALLQVHAVARQATRPIQPADVLWILAEQAQAKQLPLREIARHVARHFSLRLSDLIGSTRRQAVVHARGIAIHLARQLTGATYQQIGKQFGQRDHTTIMHACRRTEKLLRDDADLTRTANELSRHLQDKAAELQYQSELTNPDAKSNKAFPL